VSLTRSVTQELEAQKQARAAEIRKELSAIFETLLAGGGISDLTPAQVGILDGVRMGDEVVLAAMSRTTATDDPFILDAVLADGYQRNALRTSIEQARAELATMPTAEELDARFVAIEEELTLKLRELLEPKRRLFAEQSARQEAAARLAEHESQLRMIRIRNPFLFS